MQTVKDWIEDQISFDLEIKKNIFLQFDLFYWDIGIFHSSNSIQYYLGPFSITKQY
jgi:hypothetical protein